MITDKYIVAGVIGAWELFATEYPGVDVQKLLGCESIILVATPNLTSHF